MTSQKPEIGSIAWIDLTVPDAQRIKDFYSRVVGWNSQTVSMGEYSDFTMHVPENGKAVTGICHAKGSNADLPALWLIYIVVEDLDRSLQSCVELGGKIVVGPKKMEDGARYGVIQDPAGAAAVLFKPA